jgi:hypothetical protein
MPCKLTINNALAFSPFSGGERSAMTVRDFVVLGVDGWVELALVDLGSFEVGLVEDGRVRVDDRVHGDSRVRIDDRVSGGGVDGNGVGGTRDRDGQLRRGVSTAGCRNDVARYEVNGVFGTDVLFASMVSTTDERGKRDGRKCEGHGLPSRRRHEASRR